VSAESVRAIEDAIREHVAEEFAEVILTDWVVILAAATSDGCGAATQYDCLTSHSPIHTVEGLLRRGLRIITEVNPV